MRGTGASAATPSITPFRNSNRNQNRNPELSSKVLFMAGFREAPPGFEPGMADLQSAGQKSQGHVSRRLRKPTQNPLAQTLARESQIDPALARIIDAWPALPEPIRKAMVALVQATCGKGNCE